MLPGWSKNLLILWHSSDHVNSCLPVLVGESRRVHPSGNPAAFHQCGLPLALQRTLACLACGHPSFLPGPGCCTVGDHPGDRTGCARWKKRVAPNVGIDHRMSTPQLHFFQKQAVIWDMVHFASWLLALSIAKCMLLSTCCPCMERHFAIADGEYSQIFMHGAKFFIPFFFFVPMTGFLGVGPLCKARKEV